MSVEVLRLSEFLFLWRIVLLFFIGEFSIYRVLAHLEPYLQIQRNLFNKLPIMTPKTNNTCRKLRVSAFQRS